MKIALSAEPRTAAYTKATDSDLPDVDDFTVEIFKVDGGKRLYRDTYANTIDQTIYLNTGDYTLSAWHGDSLGVGFDAAYYAATVPFTVEQQVTTQIEAVAKLANVKVAVVYGDIVAHDYSNYYSVVRSRDNSKYELQFESDETRAGYLPSGSLTFELWAEDEGTWKYYSYDAGDFEPNDFVTFYVDTQHGEGSINLNITIDRGTETIEEDIDVPYNTLPKEAPTVTVSGFDSTNSIEVIEAVALETDDLKADFVAYGTITHLYMNISSIYLSNAGIPSQVDLADIDDAAAALLKAQGFKWSPAADHVLCYVDFYGILTKLYDEHYDASNPFKAEISFTVEDSKGHTATSDTYTITNAAPQFTYNINDYDIWAKRVTNQSVTCTLGNSEVIALQYKAAGDTDWTTVESSSISGTTISFDTITGLTSDTGYTFRAIYNGDEANAIAIDITTEEEAQTGNCDFEEWTAFQHAYSVWAGSTHYVTYWQPYLEDETDIWWDTNSEESELDSKDAATVEWCKEFPCAGPSTDTPDGSVYSAHLITVNTGQGNTRTIHDGTTHIGELFIGTSDSDGNHVTEGHSFPSRPDKLSFDYAYEPHDDETFCVELDIYDASGNVIASYSTTEGPSSHLAWDTFEADLDYSSLTAKAASIYISIKCSNGSTGVNTAYTVEFDGQDLTAHSGSTLRIDNIRLIYE
ncbi:MAG: DUF4493 domain-containing protein [Bacteroidales bacterium]|nr:DUF4493 domain-containing protein [Bacteroidales bacterium]